MKFIFTADWHIRPDRPICRLDEDWMATQESQIDFVVATAVENDAAIVIGGDIFHKAQVPDYLKNMLINKFRDGNIYAIAGNHDLNFHSWENLNDSSYGVLRYSKIIKDPSFAGYAHFGKKVEEVKQGIVFIHEPVFATAQDCPPNMKAKTADQVFDEYPDAKWILCGDIHEGYHIKRRDRHLVMAGCLNRQTSAMKDYTPSICLIDTDEDTIDFIDVPDDATMVTDEHIQQKSDREDRITAFVSLIKDSKRVSLDFSENVRTSLLFAKDLDEKTINTIEGLMA